MKRKNDFIRKIVSMTVLSGLLTFALYAQDSSSPSKPPQGKSNVIVGPDFTLAAEKSVHAVVHIRTEYQQKSNTYNSFFGFPDPFLDLYNNRNYGNRYTPIVATGSGVIINADGYIVTNNHVVSEAEKIEVTLNDRRTYSAKLIGTDPTADIAVIKIDETSLPYLSFGNSDIVKVGEWVLAVGNPFNLNSTVTAGIVSAKARNLNILGDATSIESFIQTDAAVNRGNSGGALVNVNGDLIGINAAIASNTGSYTGYSFAIPVNIVKKIVNDIIQLGIVQKAYFGATFNEIDSKFAKANNIEKVRGLYVNSTEENGAAKEAGIKNGDIILQMSNMPINSFSELKEMLWQHSPGDVISVLVLSDGKEVSIPVTLKNNLGNNAIIKKEDKTSLTLLGTVFETLSTDEKAKLKIKNGIRISSLKNGKFKNAGIKEGFIILSIDNNTISTLDELKDILQQKKGGVLIEGVYPNGMMAYYGFGL
ncbi:MAG: Do family serine endopeptidase [Bacteroidota bacterium]